MVLSCTSYDYTSGVQHMSEKKPSELKIKPRNIRMSEQMLNDIDRAAVQHGFDNRSSLVRRAVWEFLQKLNGGQPA